MSDRRYNSMTKRSLYACRNARAQRWGQAIVNNFGLKDQQSFSSIVDKLWNANDEETEAIVKTMIADLQLS